VSDAVSTKLRHMACRNLIGIAILLGPWGRIRVRAAQRPPLMKADDDTGVAVDSAGNICFGGGIDKWSIRYRAEFYRLWPVLSSSPVIPAMAVRRSARF
jgi:hypothetical protein